jgi:hypothetical protein
MSAEFARVQQLSHDLTEIPIPVKLFRCIVYDFKRRILGRLDQDGGRRDDPDSIQDLGHVNQVATKIKHLGNVLKQVLRSREPATEFAGRPEFPPIIDLFESAEPLLSRHFKCPVCNTKNSIQRDLVCSGCATQLQPIRFNALDDESRALCQYYIEIDIDLLPFDLSEEHANSVSSK